MRTKIILPFRQIRYREQAEKRKCVTNRNVCVVLVDLVGESLDSLIAAEYPQSGLKLEKFLVPTGMVPMVVCGQDSG